MANAALLLPFAPREEAPALVRRTYVPSTRLQRVEIVLRYTEQPAREVTRACFETFVALCDNGFFSGGGLSPHLAAGELLSPDDDAEPGSAPIETWSLRLACVGPQAFDWLVRALRIAGADVARCVVVGTDPAPHGSVAANSIAPPPFDYLRRRTESGFYVRVLLAGPANDEHEAAFRKLVGLWTSFLRALPSRHGTTEAQPTLHPSFERGASELAVAGRRLDVTPAEAEGPLVAALARFHHLSAHLLGLQVELRG